MGVGKIFFAMVDEAEIFDPAIHCREDLKVFDLKISQSEGEFATALLEIQNNKAGFLDPTFKPRIFISCEKSPRDPSNVLLFSGRVVAFPDDLSSELITLRYVAQPEGWYSQQEAFVDALKVAPYYNELFIPAENRGEHHEVLSAYSSLIHWNRATGSISLSDYIQGAEKISLGKNIFYDSVQTNLGDPPINKILLNIEAQWRQVGVGEADLGSAIKAAFTNTAISTPQVNTLTPQSLEYGWKRIKKPKGYEILESFLDPVANSFGLQQDDLSSGIAEVDGLLYKTSKSIPLNVWRQCTVPRVWYDCGLRLLGEYRQKRRENVVAEVNCTTQDYTIGEDIIEELNLRIQDPLSIVNGAVLHPSKSSFFLNDFFDAYSMEGQLAIEYGLLRARARLIKGSRTVGVSFDSPIDSLLNISCDHSIEFEDNRIPGHFVMGKVASYELHFSDTDQVATVHLACTIGTGDDSLPIDGTYIQLENVAYETYQAENDMLSSLYYKMGANDIQEPIHVPSMESDDQYLIDLVTVDGDGESQNTGFINSETPDLYLQDNKTRIKVDLKSMNPAPELAAEIEILVDDFTLPCQINLGGI